MSIIRRIDGLLLASSVAISCGEARDPRPPTRSRAGAAPAAAETPAAGQRWCFVTGEGSEIKTAPCYDDEAQCRHMLGEAAFYPVIEPCHFRSPVFCYDYLRDAGPRPQCFASMTVCAGHWEVSRNDPDDHVGPGCTERR